MRSARYSYENLKDLLKPEVLARMTKEEQAFVKAEMEKKLYALCREEYKVYVEYANDGQWLPTRFHEWICDKVQAFIEKKTERAYDVLLLSVPPQHGKSFTITETLPSWYLGKYPLKRVIEVSYNQPFAEKFGRKNKEKILKYGSKVFTTTSDTGETIPFGLARKPRLDDDFRLNNGMGGMISRGVMSGITGNAADLIILDDPLKTREEADSLAYREKLWDTWQNAIKTRLAAGAKVICLTTRWHEDDLYGRLAAQEKNAVVINIPCEAEDGDILGRDAGESLCPEIGKDGAWMDDMKKSYINDPNGGGTRAWYALYQGRPFIQEGNLIKESYWNYWVPRGMKAEPVVITLNDGQIIEKTPVELPDYLDEMVQSWDCTFKDTSKSDFVCGGVIGRRMANMFVLDCVNRRMDIIETMNAIREMTKKWPGAELKLIEEKANGAAVIQMLRQEIPGLIPINPDKSKEVRVRAWVGRAEAGNIYLPHPVLFPWVRDFIHQCKAFPNGINDDMVDMAGQAFLRLKDSKRATDVKPEAIGFRSEKELEDMGYKRTTNVMRRNTKHRPVKVV